MKTRRKTGLFRILMQYRFENQKIKISRKEAKKDGKHKTKAPATGKRKRAQENRQLGLDQLTQ